MKIYNTYSNSQHLCNTNLLDNADIKFEDSGKKIEQD